MIQLQFRNTTEQLRWFKSQLDRHLAEVEMREHGYEIQLFLDTWEVRKAILGMQAYFPIEQFNREDFERFNSRRTLVTCLAASGWLGQFAMLPPHQTEFLRIMNIGFGVGNVTSQDWSKFASEFLQEILSHCPHVAGPSPTASAEHEGLLRAIRERASSAELLFKVAESLQGTWEMRLNLWAKNNIMCLDPDNIDYESIIGSSDFKRIYEHFSHERNRPSADFSDALALTLLLERMRACVEGGSKLVPCFYDPTKHFSGALDGARLSGEFEIPPNRWKVNVLEEESYFVFRAVFSPPEGVPETYYGTIDEQRQLSHQIKDLLDTPHTLTPEDINALTLAGVPLRSIMHDLMNLSFFDNVWLPYFDQKGVQQALESIKQARELFYGQDADSNTQRAIIEQTELETRQALTRNAEETNRVKRLWNQLDAALPDTRRILPDQTVSVDTLYRDAGLLQFPLKPDAEKQVASLLAHLLDEEPGVSQEAKREIIRRYYQAIRHTDADAQMPESASVPTAILWLSGRLASDLLHLMESIDHSVDPALDIIYVVVKDRNRSTHTAQDKVLLRLEGAAASPDSPNRAGICVGLAFIYYRRFHPDDQAVVRSHEHHTHADCLAKAIRFAESACSLTEPRDMLHVYAMNNYLFYMCEHETEFGAGKYVEKMNQVAQRLAQSRADDPHLWQYRYDDTLARFYRVRAHRARGKTEWKMYIDMAHQSVERALQRAPQHRRIVELDTLIHADIAYGFKSHVRRG